MTEKPRKLLWYCSFESGVLPNKQYFYCWSYGLMVKVRFWEAAWGLYSEKASQRGLIGRILNRILRVLNRRVVYTVLMPFANASNQWSDTSLSFGRSSSVFRGEHSSGALCMDYRPYITVYVDCHTQHFFYSRDSFHSNGMKDYLWCNWRLKDPTRFYKNLLFMLPTMSSLFHEKIILK